MTLLQCAERIGSCHLITEGSCRLGLLTTPLSPSASERAGSAIVLARLSELLFVEAVRRMNRRSIQRS
jgi:hypothetical protein